MFAVVAFAAILVLAAGMASSPGASPRSTTSGPGIAGTDLPSAPRGLSIQPREIATPAVRVDGVVSFDSVPGSSTGGGPDPTNPPFAGDVRATSDTNDQTHPSTAVEPGGSLIYVAYTNQVSPSNRDVYLARSTDGGATWSNGAVAAAGYNEFDPAIAIHGSMVFIFYATDDPTIPRGWHYATSTDRGLTWTVRQLDYGALAPFRTIRSPSASSYQGTSLYVVYQSFCDVPASCGGTTSQTEFVLMFDSTGAPVGNTIYFPFGVDMIEPAIFAGPTNTVWAADYDGTGPPNNGPPGTHDIFWIQHATGTNDVSWVSPFISGTLSDDVVRAGASGFGSNFAFPYQLLNFTATGVPNHIIAVLYSINDGVTWGARAVAGLSGTEFKDPAAVGLAPFAHFTFYQGGNLGYSNASAPFTTWLAPVKVNANTGTVVDAVRSNSLTADPSTGPLIAWHDTRDGNANIYTTGLQRFTVTIATTIGATPANLLVRFDPTAPWLPSPATASLVAGTVHRIEAQTPQAGGPGTQYAFAQWNGGSVANPRTITVSADVTYTATFVTQFQITVASNPAGRTVMVNAAPQTAPYAFWCNAAAQANLSAPSPQTVSPTSQYRYNGWSDGGTQTHAITCDQSRTVTAFYVLQYQVTIQTNPTGRSVDVAGTTQTGPYVFWCDNTSSVTINAPGPQAVGPGIQYRYDSWSDLGAQTHPITCTGTMTITANFVRQYQVTIASSPSGRTITVIGTPQTAPYANWYDEFTNIGLLVPSPQGVGSTTRYSFSAWDDANVNPSRNVVADASRTYTAVFTTEYFLTMTPTPLTTVTPGSQWRPAGDIVSISTSAPAGGTTDRWQFAGWTGDLVSPLQSTTITMDGPKEVTANWNHQYKVDLRLAAGVSGANFTVDSVDTTAPATLWWNEGSQHVVRAPQTLPVVPGTRYNFASWQPGGTNRQITVTVSGTATYTAQYTRQYHVTLTITPAGPVVTVDTLPWNPSQDLWYDEDTDHVFGVVTPQVVSNGVRFKFVSWTPAGTGSTLTVRMDGEKFLQATFAKQYLLTVESSYGTPTCVNTADPGSCWYDENTTAQITVTSPVQVGGAKFALAGWTGATSVTPSGATAMMSGPKTLTANWHEVTFFEEFGLYLGLLIAILVAVIIVVLVLMRRRKKEPAAAAVAPPPPVQGTQAPAGGTKTCPACGMEIPGAATTCPVCGSAV